MIHRWIYKTAALAGLTGALLLTAGCSRSTLELPDCGERIGTLGQFENNEPVETAQMQVEREQRESEEAREAALQEKLDAAAELAAGYWYEDAAALLSEITGEDAEDERVTAAIAQYQAAAESMTLYEGDIPHLCFPGLIADTMRAFDGDDMSYT